RSCGGDLFVYAIYVRQCGHHSFPTRRSSDLYGVAPFFAIAGVFVNETLFDELGLSVPTTISEMEAVADVLLANGIQPFALGARRSEEHTSELQSRENLVCRLLLEKKNNIIST